MLRKVIRQIIDTLIPTELEFFLEDAVFDPVVAHIICFDSLARIVLVRMPCAVELSVVMRTPFGSCGWPISISANIMGTASRTP